MFGAYLYLGAPGCCWGCCPSAASCCMRKRCSAPRMGLRDVLTAGAAIGEDRLFLRPFVDLLAIQPGLVQGAPVVDSPIAPQAVAPPPAARSKVPSRAPGIEARGPQLRVSPGGRGGVARDRLLDRARRAHRHRRRQRVRQVDPRETALPALRPHHRHAVRRRHRPAPDGPGSVAKPGFRAVPGCERVRTHAAREPAARHQGDRTRSRPTKRVCGARSPWSRSRRVWRALPLGLADPVVASPASRRRMERRRTATAPARAHLGATGAAPLPWNLRERSLEKPRSVPCSLCPRWCCRLACLRTAGSRWCHSRKCARCHALDDKQAHDAHLVRAQVAGGLVGDDQAHDPPARPAADAGRRQADRAFVRELARPRAQRGRARPLRERTARALVGGEQDRTSNAPAPNATRWAACCCSSATPRSGSCCARRTWRCSRSRAARWAVVRREEERRERGGGGPPAWAGRGDCPARPVAAMLPAGAAVPAAAQGAAQGAAKSRECRAIACCEARRGAAAVHARPGSSGQVHRREVPLAGTWTVTGHETGRGDLSARSTTEAHRRRRVRGASGALAFCRRHRQSAPARACSTPATRGAAAAATANGDTAPWREVLLLDDAWQTCAAACSPATYDEIGVDVTLHRDRRAAGAGARAPTRR
jgi:hypothetical protein